MLLWLAFLSALLRDHVVAVACLCTVVSICPDVGSGFLHAAMHSLNTDDVAQNDVGTQ